jgi:hypothetical protein
MILFCVLKTGQCLFLFASLQDDSSSNIDAVGMCETRDWDKATKNLKYFIFWDIMACNEQAAT